MPLVMFVKLRAVVVSLFLVLSVCSLVQAEPKKLLIIDSQLGVPYDAAREALLKTLPELGYTQGENLEITHHEIGNKIGIGIRLLSVELPKKYDAVFLNGTIANKAAYQYAFNNIQYKFIFCSITDPIGVGLIERFGEPSSSNFTGVPYGVSVEERLRFLKQVMPDAKVIGMVYSDMPQSLSYVGWLKKVVLRPEFSDLKLELRQVPFVYSEKGHLRMAKLLKDEVKQLDPIVDLFMTPSDQFGTKREYAEVISKNSRKPIMALSKQELAEGWGAHFGIFPLQEMAGQRAAMMVANILNGGDIKRFIPRYSQGEYGINLTEAEKIGLKFSDETLEKVGANTYR